MKKMKIERRLYNVVKPEEYFSNPDLYNPKVTAVELGDVVMPIRGAADTGPGVYSTGSKLAEIQKPSKEEEHLYSAENIIDFSKCKDVTSVIEKNNMLRNIQQDLMVSGKENIFCLTTDPKDTPEMRALKSAINAKQVDKAAYADRFDQFQNDMRLLKGNSITLRKMIDICDGFDIGCILTLQDKEDAPNPMGNPIILDLTEGRPMRNESE